MNPFLLMILFSGSLLAQTPLEKETFRSKKNAFSNKHEETMQAHKAYWAAKKKVQEQDMGILNKEKKILTAKVDLENIKRGLESEKGLRKKLAEKAPVTKDTIFVKSKDKYRTVDVNKAEDFDEPKAGSREICLKDGARCFPFKEEDGKRVFDLTKKEVNTEFNDLKDAQKSVQKEMKSEEHKRDALKSARAKAESDSAASEKALEKKKAELAQFIDKPTAGIDEAFVDKLLEDTQKERLFGSFELNPNDPDTREKMLVALDQKVFGKETYGLLKDESLRYEQADKAYNDLLGEVTKLADTFKQNSATVNSARGPVSVSADESVVAKRNKTVTSDAEAGAAKVSGPEVVSARVVVPEAKKEEEKEKELKSEAAAESASPCTEDDDKDCFDKFYAEKAGVEKPTPSPCSEDDDRDCFEKFYAAKAEEEKKEEKKDEAKPCVPDADNDCSEENAAAAAVVSKNEKEPQTKEARCKEEAVQKLLELFKDGGHDILGQQFNLTAMKTALYLKDKVSEGSVPRSLEDVVNRKQSELSKDSKIKNLKELYKKHGLEKAGPGLDSLTKKLQDKTHKFNYFSSQNRMTNEEASNLYLLLDKSDTDINFGIEDAAVAWAFGKVNTAEKGTVAYNQLSISTQANKLMDVSVAGGINMSAEKLKENIKKSEQGINNALKGAFSSLTADCQDIIGETAGCVLYSDIKIDAFAAMMKAVADKTEPVVDDKKIADYSLKFDKFIGEPGNDDYEEIGKTHLRKKSVDIGRLKPESQKKLYLAAGMSILSQKDGADVILDKKCYSLKYERGFVNLGECRPKSKGR